MGYLMNCDIEKELKNNGLVCIQNENIGYKEFLRISSEWTDNDLIHGAEREQIAADDSVQEVTKGTQEVPPHIEMGRMPIQPDLAFFYCEAPAQHGGESTVYDGLAIIEELKKARELFDYYKKNKIKFSADMGFEYWKRAWGCENKKEIEEYIESIKSPDLEFKIYDDYVKASFITSAFKNNQTFFANSIFGPYTGASGGVLTLEDGSSIPASVLKKTLEIMYKCKKEVSMKKGDMIIIDNQRVMHGRNAFSTSSVCPRRMYARFVQSSKVKEWYR